MVLWNALRAKFLCYRLFDYGQYVYTTSLNVMYHGNFASATKSTYEQYLAPQIAMKFEL